MINGLSTSLYFRFFLSILTGLFLAIAWTSSSIGFLLFFAFIPLFFLIDTTLSLKKIFLFSFLSFFVWTLGVMSWLGQLSLIINDKLIVYSAFIIIPLVFSLRILFFVIIKRKINQPWVWIAMPIIWVGMEYILSVGDLSFMWMNLGFGLSANTWFIQFYQYTGLYGGSLLILSFNILVYLAWKYRSTKKRLQALLFTLIILLVIIGIVNVSSYVNNPPKGNKIKVALVQANLNPYEKIEASSLEKQLKAVSKLIDKIKDQHPDLILCTEGIFQNGSLQIDHLDNHNEFNTLKNISKELEAAILTGLITYKVYSEKPINNNTATSLENGLYYDAYNAAVFITPELPLQIRSKNILVPFMEKVPFVNTFPALNNFHLDLNQKKMSYAVLEEKGLFKHKNVTTFPFICRELLFPDHFRKYFSHEMNLITIISNMAWTNSENAHNQLLSYARALSIIFGKEVAYVSNQGPSCFINSQGEIISKTKWNENSVLVEEISLRQGQTFYAKYGDWIGKPFFYLSLFLLLFTLFNSIFFKKK